MLVMFVSRARMAEINNIFDSESEAPHGKRVKIGENLLGGYVVSEKRSYARISGFRLELILSD